MTQLIPALQKVLSVPMQEAGFPPPPMGAPPQSPARSDPVRVHRPRWKVLSVVHCGRVKGAGGRRDFHGAAPLARSGSSSAPLVARAGIMQGVMAFTQVQMMPGGECIKDGVDMLKAAMMGTFPSDAQLADINVKLA